MAAAMDAEPSTVIDIEARASPLRLLDLMHLRLLLCRSARLLRLPARRRAPAACALTCARTALSPRARRRMRRCTRDARAAHGCSSLQSVAAPAWSSRRCAWRRSTPSRATTRSYTRRRARRCAALHGRQPYLPRRRLQLTRARAAAQVMEKINGRLGAEHTLDKEWVEQTDKRAAQARVVPGAALSAPALSLRRRAHALARAPAEARAPGGGAERRQVKLSQGARLASSWGSCALNPDAPRHPCDRAGGDPPGPHRTGRALGVARRPAGRVQGVRALARLLHHACAHRWDVPRCGAHRGGDEQLQPRVQLRAESRNRGGRCRRADQRQGTHQVLASICRAASDAVWLARCSSRLRQG